MLPQECSADSAAHSESLEGTKRRWPHGVSCSPRLSHSTARSREISSKRYTHAGAKDVSHAQLVHDTQESLTLKANMSAINGKLPVKR